MTREETLPVPGGRLHVILHQQSRMRGTSPGDAKLRGAVSRPILGTLPDRFFARPCPVPSACLAPSPGAERT